MLTQEEFIALVLAHMDLVCRVALNLVGSAADADDVT